MPLKEIEVSHLFYFLGVEVDVQYLTLVGQAREYFELSQEVINALFVVLLDAADLPDQFLREEEFVNLKNHRSDICQDLAYVRVEFYIQQIL